MCGLKCDVCKDRVVEVKCSWQGVHCSMVCCDVLARHGVKGAKMDTTEPCPHSCHQNCCVQEQRLQ